VTRARAGCVGEQVGAVSAEMGAGAALLDTAGRACAAAQWELLVVTVESAPELADVAVLASAGAFVSLV